MTYWGFSGDEQVSAWLALSEANDLSGAMKMIPGSHKMGKQQHEITNDKDNVLLQGQTVRNVNEELSVLLFEAWSFFSSWVDTSYFDA